MKGYRKMMVANVLKEFYNITRKQGKSLTIFNEIISKINYLFIYLNEF